jgi:hypothetical protein
MFNKVRTIANIGQAAKEPIKAAAKKIKSVFKSSNKSTVDKYRKEALKMLKDATSKVGKDTKAAESRIGKDEAKKIGNITKSKMMKDFLKYNRDLKAKGGRIGFKKGGDLGMQSVKYGLDNNPDITKADPKAKFIAANKKNKKSKKKVI